MDNILVFSENRTKHRKYIKSVLERLEGLSLSVDIIKSEFYAERVKYLGVILTPRGVEIDLAKIATI